MLNIQSPAAEITREKKEERNRMKIYMVSLLHRATIKEEEERRRKKHNENIMVCPIT